MYYIADIAANHNNSFSTLESLVNAASQCGVDCIKLQHFKADTLVSDQGFSTHTPGGTHQDRWTNSVFDSYKLAETPISWLSEIRDLCKSYGMDLMTSPYDLDLLNESLEFIDGIKIGSGDIDHVVLLESVLKLNKPLIVATGASSCDDIEALSRCFNASCPQKKDIAILQCNTNYTAHRDMTCSEYSYQYSNLNLSVLKAYQGLFPDFKIGLSDHTITFDSVLMASVCFGATVIEKHFTLDPAQIGQDHAFSVTPDEWLEMRNIVDKVKSQSDSDYSFEQKIDLVVEHAQYPEFVRSMIGDGVKKIEDNEMQSYVVQRRSICASRDLSENDIITSDDLTYLRPRPKNSFSPSESHRLIGAKIVSSVLKHEPILPQHVCIE